MKLHHPAFQFTAFLTAAILLTSHPSAYSLGIRVADQNAHATARGNAFTATADNPSAIYYNPAGITQLDGNQVSTGIYSVYPMVEYTSPAGRSVDNDSELLYAPQFFSTFELPETPFPVHLGLGVYSPFGLSMDWPQDSGFRTLATESSLLNLSVNTVVAAQILDSLSIAAGISANYGDVELKRGIAFPGDEFKYEGDDWAPGFNFGILWQPVEQLSFGFVYRSAVTLEFDGDLSINPGGTTLPGTADFELPQTMTFGISYRPTPKWNFEFNLDWADWDSLDTVTLQNPGGDIPLVFNWQSSFMYEFGMTYYINDHFHVSGGYMYSENSVPSLDFNPSVPDTNRHVFSAGVGYRNDRWSVDLAYQLAYGPERTISGSRSTSLIGESADGKYEFLSHAVTLAVGFRL